MTREDLFMRRCFDLARLGLGHVSPNPLVGAVVVKDGILIGEGYHAAFGGPHAEANAIGSVRNPKLLDHAQLYVNLEPCSHYGKTPPCTDLILKSGISQVFISNTDPNPNVSGNGISILQNAGIEVVTDISRQEGTLLNRRNFTFHRQKRPYIILKWAQTLDGFIDIDRSDNEIPIQWITNDSAKRLVHKWRSEEDSIMVGFTTALNDNPRLTVREFYGRNPLRLVLDEQLALPFDSHLLDGSTPTLVFTSKPGIIKNNLDYIPLDFNSNIIPQINTVLYNKGIQSLVIEGGRELLDSYFESDCWDEARIFEGNKYFGKGLKGPDFRGEMITSMKLGEDRLVVFFNPNKCLQDR